MLDTYEKQPRNKLTVTIVAVLVVASIVLAADYLKTHRSDTADDAVTTTQSSSTASTSSAAPTTGSSTTATTSGTYKDGTYTASETYRVPHGTESITVSATLQDGAVTATTVKNSENDFDSARYQEDFSAGYKSHVVGKKIDGLSISIIAGASDTTEAFNNALEQIASQAQS